jgi:hypothetical protein
MFNTPFCTFSIYSAKFLPDLSITDLCRFCKRLFQISFPIFQKLPLTVPDSTANLVEQPHGQRADGIPQMMEGGGCGEVRNAGKRVSVQIIRGIQTTAGEDRKLYAGSQELSEPGLQRGSVQLFQRTVLHIPD